MMKKIPERLCVACRCMKKKDELIRAVISPENEIIIDRTGKHQGRGAYICRDQKCMERALKTRALSRALGGSLSDEALSSLTGGDQTS